MSGCSKSGHIFELIHGENDQSNNVSLHVFDNKFNSGCISKPQPKSTCSSKHETTMADSNYIGMWQKHCTC